MSLLNNNAHIITLLIITMTIKFIKYRPTIVMLRCWVYWLHAFEIKVC